ncbi:Hypothetical predicted protein [Mytilus galloprovincialis]|uniref:Uncharacterized protein n=1 Tax=Mytilus galloprovincialis TaxID=29158 RepID=A0A8B6EA99_MYTGA|nr:Hypothetical predicted protein [Mytilus galloprovincialis]
MRERDHDLGDMRERDHDLGDMRERDHDLGDMRERDHKSSAVDPSTWVCVRIKVGKKVFIHEEESGTDSSSWVTNIAIGDDIERIRLTRNELQHSTEAELGDTRFNELCNILSDLLKRLDQLNKPARLYIDRLNATLAKTVSAQEVQSIGNEMLGMDIEVEITPTQ